MIGASEYRWSLGTLIWLPVAAVFLVALIVAAGALFRGWKLERAHKRPFHADDFGLILAAAITAALTAMLLVAGTAWGMWPYRAEYHQWRTTTGTVEAIDSRLLSVGDGGPTERYVVTFTDGRQRSCDDTRCAQVEADDVLTLACKRAWQWSGTHGYDCNYVAHRSPR